MAPVIIAGKPHHDLFSWEKQQGRSIPALLFIMAKAYYRIMTG